jgi:hypothetical protein
VADLDRYAFVYAAERLRTVRTDAEPVAPIVEVVRGDDIAVARVPEI